MSLAFALSFGALIITLSLNSADCDENARTYLWWDDFPLMLKSASVDMAIDMDASALLCGVRDDPCWGIYAQRMRSPGKRIEKLHEAGIKALCWLEAYGTTQFYIAHLEKNADGSWVKLKDDPGTTRIFHNHWGWQHYRQTGEIRWVGILDYFGDHDFARPFTRTHQRYGDGYVTYPDGEVAEGYAGSKDDPRTHRVYDAACSKSILGDVTWEYGFNAEVNKIDADTGKPAGSIAGLLEVGGKYSGSVSGGKDPACPVWIDYLRASITHALDAGLDGAWVDNFSAWDSFGSQPIARAFGEWSVATFRDYLKDHFSAEDLIIMGIEDVDSFDVRIYLINKYREWSTESADIATAIPQDPFDERSVDIGNPAWRLARWIDDPVWRAYLIHKRQIGTRTLEEYYRTIKEIAATHGKPDFLVAGNDIPVISLGWVRGNLDMVGTELSWGWGTALAWLQYQYRAVPEWKLTRENLDDLKLFIIPNSIVFPVEDVDVLGDWVESGGNLIVTGTSGMRSGENGNFERRESSSLSALTGINKPAHTRKDTSCQLGRGHVHYLAQPIGLDFFKADEDRIDMLNRFDAVIGDRAEFLFLDVENIPTSVGLVAYSDGEAGRLFVDVSNTNIDVNTDEITSSPPISFSINLPDTWTGEKADIRTLCPDGDVLAEIIRREKSKITIELPSVRLYACVIISRL